MKKVAILTDDIQNPLVYAIKEKLNKVANLDLCDSDKFSPDKYDLIIDISGRKDYEFNVMTSHKSLLPSFNSNEPVKDAFLYGAKVTGITILYTKPEKILAQYPLFIHNDAHYDELETELACIEQFLFPAVAEKIIKNEPFEVQLLMKRGNCGGCKECSK